VERTPSGFTLVELILVLLLLATLSVFAAPLFSGLEGSRLSVAAVRLASAVRYAQELAMTTHSVHGVSFDLPGNRYTVYENGNPADPARDPATGFDFVVILGSGDTDGVAIQSASFGGQPRVEFATDGSPLSGGSVVLSHPSAGTRTITVSSDTGLTAP
jgi:prepilin-type N-terminal cleavage/methylation domain-containing protein